MSELTEQPYLPGLQSQAAERLHNPRLRRRVAAIAPARFPIALNRALAAEHVAFPTYAIMIAASAYPQVTIARLATEVGYSYQAIRNQIARTEWWINVPDCPISTVTLSPGGHKKLARISHRLSQSQ